MSHAVVIVSPTKERINELGIEEAIAFEMQPFDENGEWFKDGSRWDWYQIGGRWTGLLSGYDPETDPANQEFCDLCGGTGKRTDMVVADGCNACHGKGVKTKWPTQWAKHASDVIQVKDLKWSQEKAGYAFLRNRHWHEAERMGWFGCTTATECERNSPNDPDAAVVRCLHKNEADNARVVCWNEPNEIWRERFFRRFIEPLQPDDVLVVVDYHV